MRTRRKKKGWSCREREIGSVPTCFVRVYLLSLHFTRIKLHLIYRFVGYNWQLISNSIAKSARSVAEVFFITFLIAYIL